MSRPKDVTLQPRFVLVNRAAERTPYDPTRCRTLADMSVEEIADLERKYNCRVQRPKETDHDANDDDVGDGGDGDAPGTNSLPRKKPWL